MFKPNESKSAESWKIIRDGFAKKMGNTDKYVIAYGYFMKPGIFSQNIYRYIIGFSEADRELVIIPLDEDDNPADALVLKKDDIISAKFGLQGNVKIKASGLQKELSFFVPGYSTETLESSYMLPILQEDEAAQFKKFIKENFN
ncbi:hypothetical protein K7I13_13980 [Brucepastera parasyntrophica]|uniref:hypothetical protein n=1 Tax=Brucepastera parasyntrophica TaxID=2880008 RepID=UPI00210A9BE6|nr:hypothetical protein [Brucepastera parasyntrophica]ULQ59556.1 hypothetical protein K7I13_13980 [Brucepastera parasyntrophica]